eukprot:5725781-Alexandrium_andersonii.AAC.1
MDKSERGSVAKEMCLSLRKRIDAVFAAVEYEKQKKGVNGPVLLRNLDEAYTYDLPLRGPRGVIVPSAALLEEVEEPRARSADEG